MRYPVNAMGDLVPLPPPVLDPTARAAVIAAFGTGATDEQAEFAYDLGMATTYGSRQRMIVAGVAGVAGVALGALACKLLGG